MTPRFRMVAGPNGSGKTSLVARLTGDYAVQAVPYLSRAFFFDNSGCSMKYLASYSEESGLSAQLDDAEFPHGFRAIASATKVDKVAG